MSKCILDVTWYTRSYTRNHRRPVPHSAGVETSEKIQEMGVLPLLPPLLEPACPCAPKVANVIAEMAKNGRSPSGLGSRWGLLCLVCLCLEFVHVVLSGAERAFLCHHTARGLTENVDPLQAALLCLAVGHVTWQHRLISRFVARLHFTLFCSLLPFWWRVDVAPSSFSDARWEGALRTDGTA